MVCKSYIVFIFIIFILGDYSDKCMQSTIVVLLRHGVHIERETRARTHTHTHAHTHTHTHTTADKLSAYVAFNSADEYIQSLGYHPFP